MKLVKKTFKDGGINGYSYNWQMSEEEATQEIIRLGLFAFDNGAGRLYREAPYIKIGKYRTIIKSWWGWDI